MYTRCSTLKQSQSVLAPNNSLQRTPKPRRGFGAAEFKRSVLSRAEVMVSHVRCFIESSAYTPSSAWAARPLASGARFKLIVARSVRGLGVGCPSFGGQRTVGGGSLWPFAKQVSPSMPRSAAAGVGWLGSGFNSQTAGSAVRFSEGASPENTWPVAGRCQGTVVARGKVRSAGACSSGPTETAKSQNPWRQSRPSFAVGSVQWPVRALAWGWPSPLGALSAPNPSVKRTSRKRAAAYLER